MLNRYRELVERTLSVLGNLPTRSFDSVQLEQDIRNIFADTYVCPNCETKQLEPHSWDKSYQSTDRDCALCGQTWTVIEEVEDAGIERNHSVGCPQSHLHYQRLSEQTPRICG